VFHRLRQDPCHASHPEPTATVRVKRDHAPTTSTRKMASKTPSTANAPPGSELDPPVAARCTAGHDTTVRPPPSDPPARPDQESDQPDRPLTPGEGRPREAVHESCQWFRGKPSLIVQGGVPVSTRFPPVSRNCIAPNMPIAIETGEESLPGGRGGGRPRRRFLSAIGPGETNRHNRTIRQDDRGLFTSTYQSVHRIHAHARDQ
jgi:hypothetical protein